MSKTRSCTPDLVVRSRRYGRTQAQNRVNVVRKLKSMIEAAWEKPKERKMRTGLSKAGKAMRRADKGFRSKVGFMELHWQERN